ncbi:hypothetical protein Kpol_1050p112, partial [Vanderwaltozyma polyspora DSM 70294]
SKDERDIDTSEQLTSVAYGLEQYFKKSPDDAFALQCALLTLERLHLFSNANGLADRLSTILEKRFEKTQDEIELFNFAVIKSQFARIQLGLGNYKNSIENAELSDGIISDYNNEQSLQAQISNNICLGLSNFFLDNFDEALNYFQTLLQISKDSKHLILLISNILYDIGLEETKNIALDELTEYISTNGNEFLVTLTLVAMSILDNNQQLLPKLLNELEGIHISSRIKDKHKDIPYLISEINKRLEKKNVDISELSIWQRTIIFFPNDANSWKPVNKKISLRVSTEKQNKVTASILGQDYCEMKNLRNIQRGVFLSPWDTKCVLALNECF